MVTPMFLNAFLVLIAFIFYSLQYHWGYIFTLTTELGKKKYISLSFHLLKQMKNYSLSAGRILCTENKMFSFRQILKDRNGKTKEVGRQIMN